MKKGPSLSTAVSSLHERRFRIETRRHGEIESLRQRERERERERDRERERESERDLEREGEGGEQTVRLFSSTHFNFPKGVLYGLL